VRAKKKTNKSHYEMLCLACLHKSHQEANHKTVNRLVSFSFKKELAGQGRYLSGARAKLLKIGGQSALETQGS
jgi:hypothetical protein